MPKARRPVDEVREVEGTPLKTAVEVLHRHGFNDHDEGPDEVVLKKPGTIFTVRAHRSPLEARLAPAGDHDGVRLVLRYDTFVLFDQGDLRSEADRLERALAPSQQG